MNPQITWFVATLGQTVYILASNPAPTAQLLVYWNGLLQDPTQYSLSGNAVTVLFSPDAGDPVGIVWTAVPASAPAQVPGAGGPGALINVSEVVNDPDFAQSFLIMRSTGVFLNGVWNSTVTAVQGYGVIADITDRDLDMIPEGDFVKGGKVFWSSQILYATHATAGVGGSSDILVWRGLNYRVLQVKLYEDYGYWRAMTTRMKAD
jgi:hypothetical protein